VSAQTPEQIYRDLADVMTRAFPDRDLPEDVGPETRVFADLGMASIELVVLGERLEQFYGKRLPFGPFLAGLRNSGAEDLQLGDLVAFLQKHA
jgi:acyl carrier protein